MKKMIIIPLLFTIAFATNNTFEEALKEANMKFTKKTQIKEIDKIKVYTPSFKGFNLVNNFVAIKEGNKRYIYKLALIEEDGKVKPYIPYYERNLKKHEKDFFEKLTNGKKILIVDLNCPFCLKEIKNLKDKNKLKNYIVLPIVIHKESEKATNAIYKICNNDLNCITKKTILAMESKNYQKYLEKKDINKKSKLLTLIEKHIEYKATPTLIDIKRNKIYLGKQE